MKSIKKVLRNFPVVVAIFLLLLGYGVYHFFYDLNAIKPGEKLMDSVSPTGEYTITAYLNNGGATTAYAVLCQLDDGHHAKKNIYWNYRCDSAEVIWVDDDTVEINGVRLENVEKDTYDFRRDK